jgi:hypothetical protein
MAVPETPVHKNNRPVLRQHDVRLPRQIRPVKPKPEPLAMQKSPHRQFRAGVFAADPRHYARALALRKYIHETILPTAPLGRPGETPLRPTAT